MANKIDPGMMLFSAVTRLDLYSLLRHVCPSALGKHNKYVDRHINIGTKKELCYRKASPWRKYGHPLRKHDYSNILKILSHMDTH